MLQHPDAVGPGVVVARVAAGGVAAHLHLLAERPGQMVAELLARLHVGYLGLGLALLLLPGAPARRGALTQDLLQHPASAARQRPLMLQNLFSQPEVRTYGNQDDSGGAVMSAIRSKRWKWERFDLLKKRLAAN